MDTDVAVPVEDPNDNLDEGNESDDGGDIGGGGDESSRGAR